MDRSCFVEWLISNKHMSTRAAKDAASRLKRASTMLGTDNITNNSIEDLSDNESYVACSLFVKAQIKRAITLYQEHMAG